MPFNAKLVAQVAVLGAALVVAAGTSQRAAADGGVVVESIDPESARAGSEVTITGRGFGADNAIVFDGVVVAHAGVSSGIGIACTTSPNCQPGIHQSIAFVVPKGVSVGPHIVTVRATGGGSRGIRFVVMP